LSLPTISPSNSPSDSEENPPSNSTSSSTEFSLCDPDDPNPSIMVWKADNDFPLKSALNVRYTFYMIDMYGFEFCNVDDIEYKATFSIGSEGEWTTGYVGSMDQELLLKNIRVRSTGKLKENNIGIAVGIQPTDENGQISSGDHLCLDGNICHYYQEVNGEYANVYISRFGMYPYFITDLNSQGLIGSWTTYPSNFLSNIQDSYCDPDDTSARLLVTWNETSLNDMYLNGFLNRGTKGIKDNIYGFEFCGGFLEYKASFADTAETEWTTTGFVGFRDKARPLKSIRIRPSGGLKANNITFGVVIRTLQTDLGHTIKGCTEGSYCSFTGDNHGWDPVYINNISFDPFLKAWVFYRERDMSDYNYEFVKEKYGRSF